MTLKSSCFISFQGFYLGCTDTVSTMDSGLTVVSDPVVVLRITSTTCPFETEKRFMRSITIAEFKVRLIIVPRVSWNAQTGLDLTFVNCDQGKLEMIVGSSASCMDLELFSTNDKFLQKMDDNDALLGSYHVDNYCKIHVSIWSLPSMFNIIVASLKSQITHLKLIWKFELCC